MFIGKHEIDFLYGILLKGKCKKCGKDVARLVEDE
jgi:hypothetical protein